MNLVGFSPSALPQGQASFNDSVNPLMFGVSSQLQSTQASPQNPLPGQRVITPATVANLLNPVAAGSASVNARVMDTLVESTDTLVESLSQCAPCSGRINESTGLGSLTQLPMMLSAAQTVESRFSAAEYDGLNINASPVIASVDDLEGEIGSYSEVVSDFGDKAFSALFDEREIPLIPGLGTYPSMEEVKLMLSDGPHFRVGMNELITPEGGTLFGWVSSSSEPVTSFESAANDDDTGYVLKAESIADPRMEPVPLAIEDLPSVCSSPAFPALLAETGQQRIPDTQDRKSPGSANRELERTTKRKGGQFSNPRRYILGFLFEELNLPDDKRIIHWVNKKLGIFRKDLWVNHELARRWGLNKKNENMKYENLHRAIRSNYEKDGKDGKDGKGNLKHLVYGIDGQSPLNPRSPLYQFNMSSVSVKAIISLIENGSRRT